MLRTLSFTLFVFLFPSLASAHVGYVLSPEELEQSKGVDWEFLLRVLQDPQNILIMVVTIVVVALLLIYWKHIPYLKREIHQIRETLLSYGEFIPWILRLSLGITLIGAGTSQVLISPALGGFASLATLQIFIGFLLLAGLFLTPATIIALIVGIYGIYQSSYLFGNLDFIMVALSLLILANSRPGLDDIFGIPVWEGLGRYKDYVPLLFRIGIGGAMSYLALYEKFLNPHASELVVQEYGLLNVIPVSPEMWVFSAGAVELLVGLLILIGLRTRLVAAIAFLVLSLSFFYFGEDVYSHLTLFGVLSALFVVGGGKVSVDALIRKRKEPKIL